MTRPSRELGELLQYYRWLRIYGYNDAHSGNASIRIGPEVWITPTGACADTLASSEFIHCDTGGGIDPGASLDAPLHLEIYRQNPDAVAVLHSHCPHAVAMTMGGDDFVPADFEGRRYFPKVPVFDIRYEEYVETSPRIIGAALAMHRVVISRGHGVYAWGENLNQAYKWTCSLEMSAMTAWLAGQIGPR